MTKSVAQLVELAQLLPREERNELIEALLENSPCADPLIEEQIRTVEIRIGNIADGTSELVPEEAAHQQVLDSLRSAG